MNERGASADAPLGHAQTQTDLSPFDGFPPETTDDARALQQSRDEALRHRFDTSAAAEVAAAPPAPSVPGGRRASRAVDASGAGEDQSWRPRDYRPRDAADLRRQTFSLTDALPAGEAAQEYREQLQAESNSPVAPTPTAGRALTRRELRALEAARVASESSSNAGSLPSPTGSMPAPPLSDLATGSVPVPPLYELSPPPTGPHASALSFLPPPDPQTGPVSQQGLALDGQYPAPAEAPFQSATPSEPEPPRFSSIADLPAPPAPTLADLPAPPAPSIADLPAPPAADAAPQPAPQFSLAQYPAPSMPLQPGSPEGSGRGVDQAPQFFTAPLGHWSTQEAIDDATQAVPASPARDVSTSSGPITSNALVLPSIPTGSDFSVPFGTTGEILITGSISLPSTMGTTGAHPSRYDHSDLDAIIDAVDRDDVEGDSAPVRAIRAVSTHTSPRDVISQSKSGGNRLPMVLAITAGTMMVSVTVLIVTSIVFGAN